MTKDIKFEDKKIFETWYDVFQKQQGERNITVKDMFEAYKVALQLERNKHRWIPVTERVPIKEDGVEFGEGKTYNVEVIGVIDNYRNKSVGIVKYFINKAKFGYYDTDGFTEISVIKWQPLPKA